MLTVGSIYGGMVYTVILSGILIEMEEGKTRE
jgi:hypothetical protein